jgi:hypothetical protein
MTIYISYIPLTWGPKKIIKKNLPPGLKWIVAITESKPSKWNMEEYIIFTMNCSYSMTLNNGTV